MWVRSESIQKRLLSEAELTLAKAVDLAQSLEVVSKSAQTLKGTTDLAVGLMERKKARSPVEGRACHWCGKTSHLAPQCNFKDATCHTCGKKGHLARVCRSGRQQKPAKGPRRRANVVEVDTTEAKPPPVDPISTLHQVSGRSPSPYKVVLQIEGKPVEMEVNTGASVSIMSKESWLALFPKIPLARTSMSLRTYTAQTISVEGQADVAVQYGTFAGTLRMYVVKEKGPTLLGRDWLSHIHLNWADIRQ